MLLSLITTHAVCFVTGALCFKSQQYITKLTWTIYLIMVSSSIFAFLNVFKTIHP